MYFLVNASPPKGLDVATSNFADALVSSKAGICDGVPSTESTTHILSITFYKILCLQYSGCTCELSTQGVLMSMHAY